VAVFVTSLLRAYLNPNTWRAIHWLAYVSWPVALAHTFGMGTDAGETWVIVLGAACVLSVGVALVWRLRFHGRSHEAPTRRSFPGQRISP
jgi:methionine sulfoxide reductase heme-binding subunit